MKTETSEYLKNSNQPSEFRAILEEKITADLPEHENHYDCWKHPKQKICCGCEENFNSKKQVIFLRTLQPDIFNEYRPRYCPSYPQGFLEDHSEYKTLDEEYKSTGFKNLRAKYAGYYLKLEEVESHNKGSEHFLKEMYEFFKKENMPKQAEIVQSRLNDFERFKQAA